MRKGRGGASPSNNNRQYVGPRNKLEETLAKIWEQILRVNEIGVYDDFFALGGHSLLATKLVSRMRDSFRVELDLSRIFESPTIAELAVVIGRASTDGADSASAVINPRSSQSDPALSFAQRRLWFQCQSGPDNGFYNAPLALRLSGKLNRAALKRSLNEVLLRHEVLRTTFTSVDGQPKQVIAGQMKLALTVLDLRSLPKTQREIESQSIANEEARKSFDLTRGPLLRATLLRLGQEAHVLVLSLHHIVSDDWSVEILLRDLSMLYNAFCMRQPSPLAELPIQYSDFAVWQRDRMQGDVMQEQLCYWRKQLGGAPEILALPADRPRPLVRGFNGATHSLPLPLQITEALNQLIGRERVTLFMAFLAAFKVLLHRYSHQDDIVVGAPTTNRNRTELEGLIGFFVNTLVLRTNFLGRPSFRQLLSRVREVALGAYVHQDLPFERLVEELQFGRGLSHTPPFQTMFAIQDGADEAIELSGLGLSRMEVDLGIARYDLSLLIRETDQGMKALFEYNTDLFDTATIARVAGHFQTLLVDLIANPDHSIRQAQVLTPAEADQILREWNKTAVDYPGDKCIHELFEVQAERTPDAIAVAFAEAQLSYDELNRRANQLGHHLRAMGVGPEVVVGICVERSLEMVVGLLGILKAGGAYLPLDPSYPAERLRYMLEDTETPVVVTQGALKEHLCFYEGEKVCLDQEWEAVGKEPEGKVSSAVMAENLSYVIYTSGSTGRPKGAAIEHASAVAFLEWVGRSFSVEDLSGVLASTSVCFDLSVYELFGTMAWGGKALIAKNALEFSTLAAANEATLLNTVPSAITELVRINDLPSSVRMVNLAGEPLSEQTVTSIYRKSQVREVNNLYGPTEYTTYATWTRTLPNETPTIGRPIANTQVYALDQEMEPVPVRVIGELFIGGAGLSRCYRKRPDQTAERFVPNPFGEAGSRLYKTGDLARYRPDGEIEYLGRADHQVKIRGYRVELGEIEAVLREHGEVREAAAVLREDGRGDKGLLGYVVLEEGKSVSGEELREYVKGRVPGYMAPRWVEVIERLPLTANGKVDREELRRRWEGRRRGRRVEESAKTMVEEVICGIWEEVLGEERIGTDENFFELGGHSLKATQIVSRVRDAFSIELPLRTFFENPTVADLARLATNHDGNAQNLSLPPIRPLPRNNVSPLSFSQERIWFHQQIAPASRAYNFQATIRFTGPLDPAAVERSLNEIVQRHEILRTTFIDSGGQPVQVCHPKHQVNLPIIALRAMAESEREAEAYRLIEEDLRRPFDLTRLPLIRWTLFRLNVHEHVLLHVEHHLLHDGWSFNVFLRELFQLYKVFSAGEPSPLPALPIQFADFAIWQRDWMQSGGGEKQLDFWKKKLAGSPPMLELPVDYPRPVRQSFRGAVSRIKLPPDLCDSIRAFGRRQGASLFMTMLAAFLTLLHRYTGQADLCLGSGIANRRWRETENLIGMIINNVVFRTDLSGSPHFREVLARVREVTLEAYANQDVPFDKVVEVIRPERTLSHNPLFQVMFSFHDAPHADLDLPGLSVRLTEAISNGSAKFDLNIIVIPRSGRDTTGGAESESRGLEMLWEYSADLFDASTIDRAIDHYQRLIEAAISEPERRISELPILSEVERRQLLEEWMGVEIEYPSESCLHELFAQQASQRPDGIALVYKDEQVSYGELEKRSNQLGHHLRAMGVGPEVAVGLCVERSVEMVVGLLGILKAGGAYLPLAPGYPVERLRYMLEDADTPVVVTQGELKELLSFYEGEKVCVDQEWEVIGREPECEVSSAVMAENLAYVIYTSGSTGRPKGVAIEHASAVAFLEWVGHSFSVEELSGVLASTSVCFDLSVYELFGPLACGGKALIVKDALEFPTLAAANESTLINTVPSAIAELVRINDLPSSVRIVNLAGEPLSEQTVTSIYRKSRVREVNNLYGPTEYTTYATWTRTLPNETPTIGRPIANTQVYVLDQEMQPAPIRVGGELFIGGAGLARGYRKRPDQTAERFVPDPFGEAGSRLYRTGDLGRYRPDGNLEYLGRIDHQVKIRGYRIELGEVENALRDHPDVRDAVVVTEPEPDGNRRLIGYVVPEQQLNLVMTRGKLRQWMQAKLPHYMVPSVFVLLEALPLTANGKLDRNALPAPKGQPEEIPYLAPRTPMEEVLAGIWSEALRVDRVGVHDNFFDLGGHSLMAAIMIARIRSEIGIEMPLRSIFEAPTLEKFEEAIRKGEKAEAPPLVKVSRAEKLPLSFAQRRLWLADQLMPNNHPYYNILSAVKLEGKLDIKALEWAINEIIRRHEVLRTRIEVVEGEPVQVIEEWEPWRLKVEDLTGLAPDEKEPEIERITSEEAAARFDLSRGPMLRAKVLELGEEQRIMLITMHHIVTDGWSMGILIREVGALYHACHAGEGSPLEELEIQYADYAVWQRNWLQGEALKRQLSYWKRQLEGAPAVLELPTDRPRPPVQSFGGESQSLVLSAELTESLKELSRRQNVTLFMTLLAAFQTLLYRYSWQEDIVVGAGIANRSLHETENLIGFFVNMLMLRTDLSGNPSFTELLTRVREVALGAYAHQDVPFDLLVDELQPKRDLGNTPLFQVVFTLQNAPSSTLELPGVRLAQLAVDRRVSLYDLMMLMEETPQGLAGRLIYNTDLFESATIIKMLKSYEAMLEAMVARPGRRVLDVPLHPEDENYFALSQNLQNQSTESLLRTENFQF